jgi:hypothetical protein
MEVRTCRVAVPDINGVTHTAEVTAGTLYEAVALALAVMRSNDWAAELVRGDVTVSVQNVAVEHTVRMTEFYQWLERTGGSPAEKSRRRRVKEVLGMVAD